MFGATLATLTSVNANATMTPQNDNFESITIQIKEKCVVPFIESHFYHLLVKAMHRYVGDSGTIGT